MENYPLISIIVPVYNVEQYLVDCIDSIVKQELSDFELLLVNDGSSDRSGEICDGYAIKDRRIKVIHKENGGLSSARNAGLDIAQGKYIAFVDSDDLMANNALALLYEEIKNTDADIVLGKIVRFTDSGKTRAYTRLEQRKEMVGREALMLLLQGDLLNISVCGGVYKHEVFHDIRMPVGYICEDWYITPDMYLRTKKVVFLPILYYLYRDNPKSIMSDISKHCNPQVIEICEYVLNIIYNSDKELYYKTLWSNLKRVWKYVGIIYLGRRFADEQDFLEKVRRILKKYWKDLKYCQGISFSEKIGVWSFCYCQPLCTLLYEIKKKYR